jgi:hypothetical protein
MFCLSVMDHPHIGKITKFASMLIVYPTKMFAHASMNECRLSCITTPNEYMLTEFRYTS